MIVAASMLPVPLLIPVQSWPTVEAIDGYIARIPGLVAEHLYTEILQSLRLPVMHRRVQFDCPERLRPAFLDAIFTAVPSLQRAHFRLPSPALLDMFLCGTTTLPLLASFVADIFEQCDLTPPLLPQDNVPAPGVNGMT